MTVGEIDAMLTAVIEASALTRTHGLETWNRKHTYTTPGGETAVSDANNVVPTVATLIVVIAMPPAEILNVAADIGGAEQSAAVLSEALYDDSRLLPVIEKVTGRMLARMMIGPKSSAVETEKGGETNQQRALKKNVKCASVSQLASMVNVDCVERPPLSVTFTVTTKPCRRSPAAVTRNSAMLPIMLLTLKTAASPPATIEYTNTSPVFGSVAANICE